LSELRVSVSTVFDGTVVKEVDGQPASSYNWLISGTRRLCGAAGGWRLSTATTVNMTSTDLIDEIRKRLDIVDIVTERIPVTGDAAVLTACCPFHHPAEASLYVNRRQGFFHCLSCGIGGDAIKFVERYDRVSYVEATATLGARLGLVMPD
jgi:hypothetical protein